jgi:hypothetical protein
MEKRSFLFRYKRKQRDDSSPLNRQGQSPLVFRASAGDAPGQDLSPFRYESSQGIRVFIINFQFLSAEFADFFLEKDLAFSAPTHFAVPAVHPAIGSPIMP